MSDTDDQRWEEIVERELLGERVDEEDLAFRQAYEREHPACANETEAWSDMLAGLASEANAEGRTRAETLASRVLVQRDVEREVVRPLRPARTRSSTVRIAVAAVAAAAAVTAFVATRGGEEITAPESAHNQVTQPDENAPRTPEEGVAPDPAPAPSPTPNAEMGQLALAGAGVRIDGGTAVAGTTVHAGQPIDFASTDAERSSSACVVRAAPWIATCFSQGSALSFSQSEDGIAVELERGRVVVSLDPLAPGQRFSVVTSKGSVSAVGTAFEVWIDEQGTVRASVLEGRVQVRDAMGERPLEAGETTRLGDPEVGRFGADALAWSRAHVETAGLWRHANPGVLVLESADGEPRSTSVNVDALAVGRAPLSVLLPPGEHLVAQAGSAQAVTVEIEEGGAHELALAAASGSNESATARKRPTVGQLVRMASEARGAHRYRDASRHLDRILREYPDGPDAQNARVQLADLLLDKLGNPSKALRLYDAYLSRRGPLGLEARHGRVRALERLGRARDERAAIDEFLQKHPDDWRADQLRTRREALSQP